ncbi:thermonuclease family protein [Mycoplasmopsis primatum]|uniref:thermonuclease family protein n=1 Tax=Mycoplasmopsis primatum TaxID=55604 RepID=UPI001F41AC69|nr:thermonuclease family protein [Mycoplasmopsis primatum]
MLANVGIVSCHFPNSGEHYLRKSFIDSFISVVDGDTIYFIQNEQKVGLRIIGIDAPETYKSIHQNLAKYENYFAQKAKQFLISLLHNKEVYYKYVSEDKYARKVAFLYCKTEQNGEIDVGYELVKNGLARVHYISIKKGNYFAVNEGVLLNYFNKLKFAENEAKKQRLNIWKHTERDVFSK